MNNVAQHLSSLQAATQHTNRDAQSQNTAAHVYVAQPVDASPQGRAAANANLSATRALRNETGKLQSHV